MTLEKRTLFSGMYEQAQADGSVIAENYKENGVWKSSTLEETTRACQALCLGFRELGVARGVPVAVVCHARREWLHLDMAIMLNRGITVGIYDTLPPGEVKYIVDHSESRIVVLEDQMMLERHLEAVLSCPKVTKVIVVDPCPLPDDERVMSYADLTAMGEKIRAANPDLPKQMAEAVEPDDVATYMYTSGTTGTPKGVILTQRNLVETAGISREILPIGADDILLVFLPLSHVLSRVTMYIGMAEEGGSAYYAESIDKLIDNIAEVRPTIMSCVPRIFEKIHTRALDKVKTLAPRRQKIFHWAVRVGKQVSRRTIENQKVPLGLALKHKIADRLVLRKIREVLGGRINFLGSGGAPLAPEINEFFHACGIRIFEGYGLSETSAVTCINHPGAFKFGTVGKPVPGTQIKIAEDGEILIKSAGVFKGYLKDEEGTREVLKDGWFHTGDIGHLDEDGFLVITDRKKNIVITAGGKNIAPQKIENLVKQNPLISQVMVHADKRKFVSALITLDEEEILIYAEEHGLSERDPEKLAEDPGIQNEVQRAVEEANRKLPSFETIKKYKILPNDFTIDSGELTPSMKVRRKEVSKRHQDLLDSFYEE